MKKTENGKRRALRNDESKNNRFLKAFLWGIIVSAVCMVCLCFTASAFFVGKDDSAGAVNVVSPIITALSFAAGGFAVGKVYGFGGVPVSLLCGVTGVVFALVLGFVFKSGNESDNVYKIFSAFIMILSSLVGTKVAVGKRNTYGKRRM